ncbi:MAG: hypothetical protein ACR2PT_15405, partial [Endozoicomonas sp.]
GDFSNVWDLYIKANSSDKVLMDHWINAEIKEVIAQQQDGTATFIKEIFKGRAFVLKGEHISVFFKTGENQTIRSEQVHLFTKEIGLNITPNYIRKGRMEFQLYVENGMTGKELGILEDELPELNLLDWLIFQGDRNSGNFLITPEGNILAIDNGDALTGGDIGIIDEIGKKEYMSLFTDKIWLSFSNRTDDEWNDLFKRAKISNPSVQKLLFEKINKINHTMEGFLEDDPQFFQHAKLFRSLRKSSLGNTVQFKAKAKTLFSQPQANCN